MHLASTSERRQEHCRRERGAARSDFPKLPIPTGDDACAEDRRILGELTRKDADFLKFPRFDFPNPLSHLFLHLFHTAHLV
jgi:hypothetical protein